jgi:glutamyl-tRNA reductase
MANCTKCKFVTLGISHWKCPIEIREKFTISPEKLEWVHQEAKKLGVSTLFVVSTCNRTQFFARTTDIELLKTLYIKAANTCQTMFFHYGFVLEGKQAIDHIFELCMGLDSMILGDLQIINQVKVGVKYASKFDLVDPIAHRLMQFVYQCYKSVSTDTDINQGPASIAHASVLFIKEKFTVLKDKNVLLYGVGEIGETTVKNLLENHHPNQVTLINRTFEKAEKMAQELNIRANTVEALSEEIGQADIIIVATGSQSYTITEDLIPNDGKDKIFIDLAVPRNIDPKIDELNHVELVEMDVLNKIQDETLAERRKNIPKVKTIINIHQMEYYDWMKMREISPLIASFRQKMEGIRQEELQKQQFRFTENELQKADVFSKSVMNKVMNQTIEYIKNQYRKNHDIIDVVNEMFQLKDPRKLK